MAQLEAMNKTVEAFRSLTLDEVDRLNDLLLHAEAIFGAITMLDIENEELLELGYILRLADKGIDIIKEAFEIINKK